MAARTARRTRTNPGKILARGEQDPEPTERAKLAVIALHKRRQLGKAKREGQGFRAVALAGAGWMLAKVNTLKPVRVLMLYTRRRGPLMAAGISYNLFFSVAAMLVAGFSILGLVVAGNTELQRIIVNGVDRQVPNLIGTGDDNLVTPEQLFNTGGALSLTLIISTAVTLWTALRWINSLRQGMRGIFDLPPLKANYLLTKGKDLGILALLAFAMLVTLALGVVVNTLLDSVVAWLGLGDLGGFFTRVAGIAVMLILDMVVAVIMFRQASGIRMPRMAMFQAALIAGAGSTILRMFSTELLGSVGNNPLLDPFAVILGLFVWFFLLSQVYLLATAWGAIRTADVRATRRSDGSDKKHQSLRQQAREGAHRT